MIKDSWEPRIRRASALAGENSLAAPLLAFCGRLLREQKKIYEALDAIRPAGEVDRDLGVLASLGSDLLRAVAECGPDTLAAEAHGLLSGNESRCRELLLTYWVNRSDRLFFAKALMQPYGEWRARAAAGPIASGKGGADNRCPRCGGAPQVSILENADPADGSSRHLQCALCASLWTYRRVRCPSCGNEDEPTLGYYHSGSFPHVRVDTCERCGRYLKTIDLRTLGLAVPLIDEIAAAPLDMWAAERGYQKIELNLVGL